MLEKIAVIGAGLAGREFALRCVAAGFAVVLEDVMPEKLRRAEDAYLQSAPDGASAGTLLVASEVEGAVRDADVVVDFVPDELESKLEIFSLVDRMAPPRTILLTPTETLDITDLASCTYRAARCVAVRGGLAGGHATLVRGVATLDDVVALVRQMLQRVGVATEVAAETVVRR